MKVVVAVEFEVSGWDGRGGHQLRQQIEKEDRGSRVAEALHNVRSAAKQMDIKVEYCVFPGTTFTDTKDIEVSGIDTLDFPVLYEAPNTKGDEKQLNPDRFDRVVLHDSKGRIDWLQRVTRGGEARVLSSERFGNSNELVQTMLSEVGTRITSISSGSVLPLICGEIGIIPMHRAKTFGKHQSKWPNGTKNEKIALKTLEDLWNSTAVIVNPFHTPMAWYSDVRRSALSRDDKIFIGIGNLRDGTSATGLRVFVNGRPRWKARRDITTVATASAKERPVQRGDIVGVWHARSEGPRDRYWFVGI